MRLIKSTLSIVTLLVIYSFIHTDRNIIKVLANANDKLIFEYQEIPLSKLTDTLKLILSNKDDNPNFPENKYKNLSYFGKVKVSKAVVSIACDRGTSYEFYIKVQNEVERAYNELRNELSLKEFKTNYRSLDENNKNAIDSYYPKRISEAEPRVWAP